jgi:hypothetical protein
MKRHRRRIRIWLFMAATATSLVSASSAAAARYAGDDAGPIVNPHAPVSTTSQGFDWTGPAIVVAVVVLVALAAYAFAQVTRSNRGQIAPSH